LKLRPPFELLKCLELLKACARAWDSSRSLGTRVSSFINGIPLSVCVCGARGHILVREYNLVREHTFYSGIVCDKSSPPPSGGIAAPARCLCTAGWVPTYASAAYGCALAHSPQTTREVRATFYSRLSQHGYHAAPLHLRGALPARSRGRPPGVARPFSIGPHFWGSIYPCPTLGFDLTGDSSYDKSPDRGTNFTGAKCEPISGQNRLTGEPILSANQYLARYWFAVRFGKIGSPVRRCIINRGPDIGSQFASVKLFHRSGDLS
jgi:hypothetical protein